VSFAALGLARKICGELKGLTALVLGAGDMAALTARHLQAQQPAALLISSRTPAHAKELADEVGGQVIPWDETDGALAAADIVVSATGATTPIVTRDRVRRAMRSRRTRPLFLIDIAVPRDVEAEAGEIDQVFVYNIDDLRGIVSENVSRRASEVEHAEAIVRAEVDTFLAWARSRTAIPTVVALRRRFEAVRQAELARLQPKLSALTPEGKQKVDEVTRLIIEKLLLTPTEQLKALADRETVAAYTDALNRLFALGPDSEENGSDSENGDMDDAGDAQSRRKRKAVV
jgi:glutamyl-tRNA reductase